MPRGSKEQLEGVAREHYDAFCRSFLLSRYRERKLGKPWEFLEDLCHRAGGMLDLRRAIGIPASVAVSNGLMDLVSACSNARTGVYLGTWSGYPIGEHPTPECLRMIDMTGGAIASIEPGQLAVYCSEPTPDRDWLLLVADEKRREQARVVVQRLA